MGCCTSGSAANTLHENPGGSSIVRATSSAGIGPPGVFTVLKIAGKSPPDFTRAASAAMPGTQQHTQQNIATSGEMKLRFIKLEWTVGERRCVLRGKVQRPS